MLTCMSRPARIGAIDALRCGTTTLIDHHASPNAISGSLDAIERGIASVSLRGVLCYETTDRNGRAGRDAGLEENRRYLSKCASRKDGRLAGGPVRIGLYFPLRGSGDVKNEKVEGLK